MSTSLTKEYWDTQYLQPKTGWDIGYPSPPLAQYFDQLTDKNIRILIPGAGMGWEVEYLYKQGFVHVFLLDFSKKITGKFMDRCPYFPRNQVICSDFFGHTGSYDLIVEQTFFSSLPRDLRLNYVNQLHDLLKPGGKVVGLLFNHEFTFDAPPFGGSEEEYRQLFEAKFQISKMVIAHNSIKPRQNRELFFILEKPKDTN